MPVYLVLCHRKVNMFVKLKICLFSALLTRIWAAQTSPNIVFIVADDLVKLLVSIGKIS